MPSKAEVERGNEVRSERAAREEARVKAVKKASKLLDAKGREVEAMTVLLPDALTRADHNLLKEALCEASAILTDAAKRVKENG